MHTSQGCLGGDVIFTRTPGPTALNKRVGRRPGEQGASPGPAACPRGCSLLGTETTTFPAGRVLVRGTTGLHGRPPPSPGVTERTEVYLSHTQVTAQSEPCGGGVAVPAVTQGAGFLALGTPLLAGSHLSPARLELGHCHVWVPPSGKRTENMVGVLPVAQLPDPPVMGISSVTAWGAQSNQARCAQLHASITKK